MSLENHFKQFRENTIGYQHTIITPFGEKSLIYADWIASGRLYKPLEEKICNVLGPMVANTHSEASDTGKAMTLAYHKAHEVIKKHVNANDGDAIITVGSGMTGALAKLYRILGLRIPEQLQQWCTIPENEKPVIFLTHMEHHSNHTAWLESVADVVILPPTQNLLVNTVSLNTELEKYKDRKVKIGSFTACSNVTGIRVPYHELAKIMHAHGGYCFVDFAASAPYDEMDMHPKKKGEHLDAIFFSPHKFLGGPGSSGVLIFNKSLYKNKIPDHPGGGTVLWTNPWGGRSYFDDIEIREDGGTPGFLQAIRTAFSIKLKEQMGVDNMRQREEELLAIAFEKLNKVKGINILAGDIKDRLGVISFYIDDIHFNLIVKLLNDVYGIQVRGGCSCAGTYGHYLLYVDKDYSKQMTDCIDEGNLTDKPGWVRLSLHPTMTNDELNLVLEGINEIVENIETLKQNYTYNASNNEFYHVNDENLLAQEVLGWFESI